MFVRAKLAGAIKICCTCKDIGNFEMKKKMIPIDNEVHCVGAPPLQCFEPGNPSKPEYE